LIATNGGILLAISIINSYLYFTDKEIMKDLNKILSNWISTHRELSGMTQKDLSSKLNRPQSYISKIENGSKKIDLIEFITLSKELDIDPSDLISILFKELE
jgi:ribosome-binding protein aMBF1 (putative translation factor)